MNPRDDPQHWDTVAEMAEQAARQAKWAARRKWKKAAQHARRQAKMLRRDA